MQTLKNIIYSLVSHIWHPRNSAVILTYHSISAAPIYSAIHPDRFASQMKLLHDEGFNVVSLATLAEYRAQGTIPPKTVCITFDDGYLDNYTNAFPILKQYNFPATIFVITSAIGGEWQTRGDSFVMMGESELKELNASGLISLEPHTVTHPKLAKISFEDSKIEIKESKEILERVLGTTCEHFAYPFGRYSREACKAVAEAGIPYAYTMEAGFVNPRSDAYLLHRNGLNRINSHTQFRGIALCGRLSRARLSRFIRNFV